MIHVEADADEKTEKKQTIEPYISLRVYAQHRIMREKQMRKRRWRCQKRKMEQTKKKFGAKRVMSGDKSPHIVCMTKTDERGVEGIGKKNASFFS